MYQTWDQLGWTSSDQLQGSVELHGFALLWWHLYLIVIQLWLGDRQTCHLYRGRQSSMYQV